MMQTDTELTLDEEIFKALADLEFVRRNPGFVRIKGLKGKTYLDAGFVYAPYIPIQTTPIIDLNDFQPVKTLFKR